VIQPTGKILGFPPYVFETNMCKQAGLGRAEERSADDRGCSEREWVIIVLVYDLVDEFLGKTSYERFGVHPGTNIVGVRSDNEHQIEDTLPEFTEIRAAVRVGEQLCEKTSIDS
jgi:hypothetical protein